MAAESDAASRRFEHTETARADVTPDAVWALWRDPSTWPTWDPAVQDVHLDAPFGLGVAGTMVIGGGLEVPVSIEVVEEGRRYVDVLRLGELEIRIDHLVEADGEGCVLTVATVLTGPGADGVGPMVTQEAPQALARLVELAAR